MSKNIQGYVDDEVAEAVKVAAKSAGKSVAAWVGELCKSKVQAEGFLGGNSKKRLALAMAEEALDSGLDPQKLIGLLEESEVLP